MKGSLIVAVLSAIVFVAAADFGPWSDWSECLCSQVELRTRVCVAEPCVGDDVESRPCVCVPTNPPVDCPMVHGANSVDGILPDNCNCSNYVQCVRDQETDEFTGYFRSCNPCEIWDQEVLTCVLDQSQPNCVFQPSTQATGPCPLGVVEGNEFQFMLGNDTIMDCAPGTKFNYSVCTCVHYDPVHMWCTLLGADSDIGIVISPRGGVRDIEPAFHGSGFALISHGSLSGSRKVSSTPRR
ncbi:hypothetical protein LSAT2_021076 [Lamellibrachia satsuma]|nr:hypothetical protein LSAT2_021076 [Lamellibrachia satsuma]